MDPYQDARQRVDAVHSADPGKSADGRPAELAYADNMERWVARIAPDASPILRLAARCQHLERWATPRALFPEGKAGYLSWRRSLYVKQADRARDAGVPYTGPCRRRPGRRPPARAGWRWGVGDALEHPHLRVADP